MNAVSLYLYFIVTIANIRLRYHKYLCYRKFWQSQKISKKLCYIELVWNKTLLHLQQIQNNHYTSYKDLNNYAYYKNTSLFISDQRPPWIMGWNWTMSE